MNSTDIDAYIQIISQSVVDQMNKSREKPQDEELLLVRATAKLIGGALSDLNRIATALETLASVAEKS